MTYINKFGNICYGSQDCNSKCTMLWIEWFKKYADGKLLPISEEGWAARRAMDEKVVALREADRTNRPECYVP